MGRVLVVEDDENVMDVIKTWLEREGYEVIAATDGLQGLEFMNRNPDLVILDVMLPGLDGLSVCQQIRESSKTPILMLSARGDTIDRVVGLETGADDYLGKPFHPKELVARVRAMFRRQEFDQEVPVQKTEDLLTIDTSAHKAFLAGEELDLTLTEYELLRCLFNAPNRVLSRQELLDRIWGDDYFGSPRVVDSHIRNLRAKLKAPEHGYDPITSVRGVGYRYEG
jgi:DNA-binding response OmpR family regulator